WYPVARVVASQIPALSARARRITACDSRESSKSICKEIALQRPKTGKFDYLSELNHPAHSMAFKFFTDDELSSGEITGRDSGTMFAQTFPMISNRATTHSSVLEGAA